MQRSQQPEDSIPPTNEQAVGEAIIERIRAGRHLLPLRRTRAWIFTPRSPHKTTEAELRRAFEQFKAAHRGGNADILIATRDVFFKTLEDFFAER